jgi:TrmH family RNA methyltransferase
MMKSIEILSLQNPRVKEWSSLLERKGRLSQQKFLVEGVHLVREAFLAHAEVEYVLFSQDRGIPVELRDFTSSAIWVCVTEAIINKCSDTKTPQAVVAIVKMPTNTSDSWLTQWSADEFVVVVDRVQDPGNVGTLIRSAAAVGVNGIVLGEGCADPYAPKTIRATMGALFRVPIVQSDLHSLLPHVRQRNGQILVAQLNAERSLYECDFRVPTWLIVGNEGAGVDPALVAHATHSIRIPMHAQQESLNVAMATTVILYEAYRQRIQ